MPRVIPATVFAALLALPTIAFAQYYNYQQQPYQPPAYQPPVYQGPVYAVPPGSAMSGQRQFLQMPQPPQHSTFGCFPNCY